MRSDLSKRPWRGFKLFEKWDDLTVRDYLKQEMYSSLSDPDLDLDDWTNAGALTSTLFSGSRRPIGGGYLAFLLNLGWSLSSATGQFDAAFTEAVIDSIAFDYFEDEEEEWKSVEGKNFRSLSSLFMLNLESQNMCL